VAVANYERIGKALDLFVGLVPYVEHEL